MSRARQILLLAVLGVLGCNNNNGNSVSFAFNRPERLDFACFAQYAETGITNPALNGTWKVMPRSCCTVYDATSFELTLGPGQERFPDDNQRPSLCLGTLEQPLKVPTLHALVTQSTRGEVAAVDLVANRVLDSDRQVPGFTFLDTGGLPSAIVVPPTQSEQNVVEGPVFFYVASAEQNEIRAIPTCRFRSGSSTCGPDRDAANADAAYADRLRVTLPGSPADMILGPDQKELWVTLPAVQGVDGVTRGLLARIALPPEGDKVNAFALDPATRLPPPVSESLYGVPAVSDVPMGEPVAEATEYRTSCGLGVSYAAANFTLPTAPRADVKAAAEPQRMRFDKDSGLLFVSDRASPGVHVFRPGPEGSLVAL
ncbi:MAG TPA: hypothetical protein VFX59_19980, partial [Polyangiales bacterium]|nr:hypothetical protein [Polyangiales bacterium]